MSAEESDQICVALKGVLEHPTIWLYYNRIVGETNSETARLGQEAVAGMQKLIDIVAANRVNGGRSKQCRSLLQTIS